MSEPLEDLLDKLSSIDLVSVFLERLAEDIATPSSDLESPANYHALVGERARGLYTNFGHSLTSPVAFAPLLAVRPLVELAILAKWISLDPEFHGFLWFADSEASELTHLDAMLEHSKTRGSPTPKFVPHDLTPKRAIHAEALRRLRGARRNYGKNRLTPSVIRMVEEVEKQVPGHKIAMRDAYEYAYRAFSPWEHSSASSFKATAEPTPPDSWRWLGDRSPFHIEAVQAIGASVYAYILEVVFLSLEHENATLARTLRDYVTVRWVRSDRVQPTSQKLSGEGR